MKIAVIAFIAALAVGCSGGTPISPSASSTLAGTDASAVKASSQQKVTLFFYSDDDANRGNVHITGLPVTVVASPSNTSTTLETNRQGSISLRLPGSDTSIWVTTPASWNGFCGTERQLSLPLRLTEGWILIHTGC